MILLPWAMYLKSAKQRDFYARYIRPLAGKNTRAFVIISDALRYEVAAELCDTLIRTTKGTAKLEAMQAIFPSITKFGMAALLPGRKITVDEDMDCLCGGTAYQLYDGSRKVLCTGNPNSVAIQHNDVLSMKRAERRELVSGKEVVYVYHNTIDAIGDKAATENKVFEACEDAIMEISKYYPYYCKRYAGDGHFYYLRPWFPLYLQPSYRRRQNQQECLHGESVRGRQTLCPN